MKVIFGLMGVTKDHVYAPVSREALNRWEIDSCLHQVGNGGMAQGVATDFGGV